MATCTNLGSAGNRHATITMRCLQARAANRLSGPDSFLSAIRPLIGMHDSASDEAQWPAWNVLYDRIC
jgi:hypothetical protein